METKIEAACVRDEKFAKEYFFYHSYQRPVGVIVTIACILVIISGVINVFAEQKYWAAVNIALGVYLLVLQAVRVRRAIKRFLDRDKESNHGNFVSVQNLVTENLIVIKSPLNESGTEYEMSCIEKVYRSKNYIYLITKAKSAIVFDVNNFSKGTPEELLALLRQKGIKIK